MTEQRKYSICVCMILSLIVLFLFGNLTEGGFVTMVGLTFGTFVAGNVAEKFTGGNNERK